MLRITLKNGSIREFKSEDFTDYEWKPQAFIVLRNRQWVAIFNWDEILEVLYLDEPEE